MVQTQTVFATPGELPEVILLNIKANVSAWETADIQLDDITISRLNGLSNACYRVALKDRVDLQQDTHRVLLYRKFECKTSNLAIEAIIFKDMSD